VSRSHKPRYGTRCKLWKDTVRSSRSQKRAWAIRKRIEARARRRSQKQAPAMEGWEGENEPAGRPDSQPNVPCSTAGSEAGTDGS